MQITIRDELVQPLQNRAKEKGFDTLEAYIDHILQQIAEKVENTTQVMSKKDEEKVVSRLRDLGYL
ncbi:MAG: CopG family transcriptional regulator [Theionarchaea archaeon]|nr:CopG family transcriptional regulator [Theionarchaea archaeon]